jgi:hypothetical protein
MKLTRILFAGLVTIISACDSPAFFSSSLSEPGETPIDEAVVGVWYVPFSKTETAVLNVVRIGEDRLGVHLNFMESTAKSNDAFLTSDSRLHLLAHPSEINGERFYNVSLVNEPGVKQLLNQKDLEKHSGFMIQKARVIDEHWLIIYVIMEGTPETLAGWSRSNASRVADSASYTVSRDDLRELIVTAETDKLFEPFMFFRRLPAVTEELVPPEIRNVPEWKMK